MSLWRYLSSTKMIILSHTEEWGQNVWAWSHQNLQVSCILKCASCWHQNVRILEKKGHSFVSFNWAHEILPIFIILTYDVALSALSLLYRKLQNATWADFSCNFLASGCMYHIIGNTITFLGSSKVLHIHYAYTNIFQNYLVWILLKMPSGKCL